MSFFSDIKEINGKIEKRKQELKKINSKCSCNRGVIKELNDIIDEREDIIYFTGGTYEKQYYNIFITNKRVIFLSSILLNTAQLQISIEKINSISKTKGLIVSKIKIWDGSGSITGVEIERVPTGDATIFVNKVNEQINNYKSFSIEVNKTVEKDIMDKIEKLSELYKDGVLTEYEFATKKLELLEKLKK